MGTIIEPLTLTLADATAQTGIPPAGLLALARDGEVEIIEVAGQKLVVTCTLRRFLARVRRRARRDVVAETTEE
jgi:hypothetical protein